MNRIKEMRKAKGYTQEKLATLLHTTQANLSGWEAGKWKPDSTALAQMADIFGVSVDYLLGRTDESAHTHAHVKGLYPLYAYVKIPALGIIRGGQPICTEQGADVEYVWADKLRKSYCLVGFLRFYGLSDLRGFAWILLSNYYQILKRKQKKHPPQRVSALFLIGLLFAYLFLKVEF